MLFYEKVNRLLFSCLVREDAVPTTSQRDDIFTGYPQEKILFNELKESVVRISKFLEKFEENFSSTAENAFNFKINFSDDNAIQCQSIPDKNRLRISCENNSQSTTIDPVQLHKCNKNEHTQPVKSMQRFDKKIQKSPHTLPKIIDTGLLQLTNFHLSKLKLNLLEHLKGIKNDVTLMKKLMWVIENASKDVKNAKLKDCLEMERNYLMATEELKFFEAELRAKNFCKFYKLCVKKSGRSIGYVDSPRSILSVNKL